MRALCLLLILCPLAAYSATWPGPDHPALCASHLALHPAPPWPIAEPPQFPVLVAITPGLLMAAPGIPPPDPPTPSPMSQLARAELGAVAPRATLPAPAIFLGGAVFLLLTLCALLADRAMRQPGWARKRCTLRHCRG